MSRKRIPLNQNGCTANFRIGVPFEQNLQYENGELLTIKTDKHFHGIGMKSVKKIVEKYEGQLEYDNKQNIFEVSITLF